MVSSTDNQGLSLQDSVPNLEAEAGQVPWVATGETRDSEERQWGPCVEQLSCMDGAVCPCVTLVTCLMVKDRAVVILPRRGQLAHRLIRLLKSVVKQNHSPYVFMNFTFSVLASDGNSQPWLHTLESGRVNINIWLTSPQTLICLDTGVYFIEVPLGNSDV